MVPSSAFTVIANGERLSRSYFSLGETIHFRSLELITDRLSSLSLSPSGDFLGAIITLPAVNHDGGLHRFSHDHTKTGRLFNRSSYNNYPTTACDMVVRHQPPPRVTARLSGGRTTME
jgi:hypothetical protein